MKRKLLFGLVGLVIIGAIAWFVLDRFVFSLGGTLPPVQYPEVVSVEGRTDFVSACTKFAFDNFEKTTNPDEPYPNHVFSFSCFAVQMGLIANTLGGDSLSRFTNLLGCPDLAHDDIGAQCSAYMKRVSDREEVQIEFAARFWDKHSATDSFKQRLSRYFGSEIVPLPSDSDAAVNEVNSWVDQATHNRIPEILERSDIGRDTSFVIANTVWLKGSWASERNPEPLSFRNASGGKTKVPSMTKFCYDAYRDSSITVVWDVLGRDLQVALVMPDDPISPDQVRHLASRVTVNASERPGNDVSLTLPIFTVENTIDIAAMLKRSNAGFLFEVCDFTGCRKSPFEHEEYYRLIKQANNIAADEKGIEAASAGVAAGCTGSDSAPTFIPITFDRPFMMVIYDSETRDILYVAIVNDLKHCEVK